MSGLQKTMLTDIRRLTSTSKKTRNEQVFQALGLALNVYRVRIKELPEEVLKVITDTIMKRIDFHTCL